MGEVPFGGGEKGKHKFEVPLGKCNFLVILDQILKTFFILYLLIQSILKMPFNFYKLKYWQSYCTFKVILR